MHALVCYFGARGSLTQYAYTARTEQRDSMKYTCGYIRPD